MCFPPSIDNRSEAHLMSPFSGAGESEPLIPAHTPFILTTDTRLLASSSTNKFDFNAHAEEFYFERPEVMEAIRAQRQVQTAEFRELKDEDHVTGRLRYRNDTVRPMLPFPS